MTSARMPTPVDPLFDFDGRWTTDLADQYLPDPRFPEAMYECVDGRLIVSPAEASSNVLGAARLLRLIGPPTDAAGLYALGGTINLTFSKDSWINPDLTVLHTLPATDEEDTWVPAGYALLPIEFLSPGSRNRSRDMIDKPGMCARAGIPYFMRVQIVRRLQSVQIELLELANGAYEPVALAAGDQLFETGEPFQMRFKPRELLP